MGCFCEGIRFATRTLPPDAFEPHSLERLPGQLHREFSAEGSGGWRDRHFPWVDQIGTILRPLGEVELVFAWLIHVEVEKIVSALLSGAEVIGRKIIQSLRRRALQNLAQKCDPLRAFPMQRA